MQCGTQFSYVCKYRTASLFRRKLSQKSMRPLNTLTNRPALFQGSSTVYVIIVNNLALFSTLCSNLQTRALWALVSNNPVSENPPFRPLVLSLLVVVSGIFAFSHFLVSQRSLGGLEIQCLFPFAPSFVHCWVLNMSRDHFFHLPWLSH